MTIAACYLSMEGVVLGADSTTTINVKNPTGELESHHFDFAQKIFEVGRDSQIGVAVWGMGSFADTSYRTMIAELGDEADADPAKSVEDIARSLGARAWKAFEGVFSPAEIANIRDIANRAPDERSPDDAELLARFGDAGGGFCVAGCRVSARTPCAYQVNFDLLGGVSAPDPLQHYRPRFWGAPNMVNRLIYGVDGQLLDRILASGKWTGSEQDLIDLAALGFLQQPNLPLREAVDWVYGSVFATIKAFKFSQFQPICGGPVEIAIISTDRPFRWVKHKSFDAAI
jgi:hypothetical protein